MEREARAISALNHPHICHLYDIGSQDGTDFLVMEFLEGETLANRLRKGALPLPEILKIGIAIAEALALAHRQGIVAPRSEAGKHHSFGHTLRVAAQSSLRGIVSNRNGHFNLFRKHSDGSGAEELLLTDESQILTSDCSRDGKFLFYSRVAKTWDT